MKLKNLLTTALLSVTLMVSASANAATATTKLDPAQVKQIETVIHDYLLQNPQLMVEVFQKLQTQQQAEMDKRALKAVQANANELYNDPNSPVVGNAKGTVTLVEFFDYQCPHCKAMASVIGDLVKNDQNLKVVFKEFPIFPGSEYAAQAALAAQLQGKYWKFHDALLAANNPLTKNDVLTIAKNVGLDVPLMEKDMKSDAINNEIKQNEQLAEKLGLAGTPAFIVQSNTDKNKAYFVPGQVESAALQQLIQKAAG